MEKMKKEMIGIILESAAEYNNLGHLAEFWNYYKGQTRMYNLVTKEDICEKVEDYGEESDIIEITIGEIECKWNPITKRFTATIERHQEIDPTLARISRSIAIECYLNNLAVDQADEYMRRYHAAKIRGLGAAVNCMDVDIYVHHEKDRDYRKIEYFTLSQNGEILIEENDFYKAAKEAM
jgi:hypothetical protein